MATNAQLNANRADAQLSIGPTSETGKSISSKNALKTGLTGRTVLLPTEDAALYESHLASFRERLYELFPNEEESVRKQLIEAKIFLTYQRQLNNLSIQENRLRKQREKDAAALKQLQEARERREGDRIDQAARQYIKAFRENRHEQFDPAAFGFEFSREQIHRHALLLDFHFNCEYHRWLKRAA